MATVRVGDLDLHYEVDGQGEPLLCLMGLGGARGAWDLVRPELARRHRLILVDNRDAGDSAEASGAYGLADMANDALAVLDHLGVERFHVLGASMGGAVAQHLALGAPARVASHVLASTWGRTDGFLTAVFTGWRRLVATLAPGDFLAVQAPWAFTHRFFDAPPPELVAHQRTRADRVPFKSSAAYQRQVDACLAHDVLALLVLLRTPALVLVGEDDVLTPARYGRALAAALPRGDVMMVPASGHACFLETPKPFAERVLRFLARHTVVPA